MDLTKKLGKSDILSANDLKTERVEVPEWGGYVTVSTMAGMARDAYESSMITRRGNSFTENLENARAKLCAATLIDEDTGDLLFKPNEIKRLGKKSCAALDRVYAVATRLNGVSEADVEELAKNS